MSAVRRASSSRASKPRAPRSRFRTFGIVTAGLSIALFAASCGSTSDAESTGTASNAGSSDTTAAVPTEIPAGTVLRVADQFGLAEIPLTASGAGPEAPYEIQYSNFVGAPAVLQAFQAGEVDVAQLGDAGIIPPQAAGQDVVVIGVSQNTGDGNGFGVITGSNSDIESVDDLKGKKVGYAAGTAVESYILQLLADSGLTPDDVELVNLPATAGTQALQSGDIDATGSANPLAPLYLSQNPDAAFISPPGVYSGLAWYVTTSKVLKDPAKAAALGDYLQRVATSQEWINDNPDEWKQKYLVEGFKVPTEVAAGLDLGTTHVVPIDDEIIARQQATTDLFTASGSIPETLDVSEIFDLRYNPLIPAVPTP